MGLKMQLTEIKKIVLSNYETLEDDISVSDNITNLIANEIVTAVKIIKILPKIKNSIINYNDILKATVTISSLLEQLPKTNEVKLFLKNINDLQYQLERYKNKNTILTKYENIFNNMDENIGSIPTKYNIQNLLLWNIKVLLIDHVDDLKNRDNIAINIIREIFKIKRLPRKEMKYHMIKIYLSKEELYIEKKLAYDSTKEYIYKF
jgi:hypothetical protein